MTSVEKQTEYVMQELAKAKPEDLGAVFMRALMHVIAPDWDFEVEVHKSPESKP